MTNTENNIQSGSRLSLTRNTLSEGTADFDKIKMPDRWKSLSAGVFPNYSGNKEHSLGRFYYAQADGNSSIDLENIPKPGEIKLNGDIGTSSEIKLNTLNSSLDADAKNFTIRLQQLYLSDKIDRDSTGDILINLMLFNVAEKMSQTKDTKEIIDIYNALRQKYAQNQGPLNGDYELTEKDFGPMYKAGKEALKKYGIDTTVLEKLATEATRDAAETKSIAINQYLHKLAIENKQQIIADSIRNMQYGDMRIMLYSTELGKAIALDPNQTPSQLVADHPELAHKAVAMMSYDLLKEMLVENQLQHSDIMQSVSRVQRDQLTFARNSSTRETEIYRNSLKSLYPGANFDNIKLFSYAKDKKGNDTDQIIGESDEVKAEIAKWRESTATVENLQTSAKFIRDATAVAAFIGKDSDALLVRRVVQTGQIAATALEAISKHQDLADRYQQLFKSIGDSGTKGALTTAALSMNYAAIGVALASALMGGKSESQLLMEQIQEVAETLLKRIDELEKNVNKRFDQVDKDLGEIKLRLAENTQRLAEIADQIKQHDQKNDNQLSTAEHNQYVAAAQNIKKDAGKIVNEAVVDLTAAQERLRNGGELSDAYREIEKYGSYLSDMVYSLDSPTGRQGRPLQLVSMTPNSKDWQDYGQKGQIDLMRTLSPESDLPQCGHLINEVRSYYGLKGDYVNPVAWGDVAGSYADLVRVTFEKNPEEALRYLNTLKAIYQYGSDIDKAVSELVQPDEKGEYPLVQKFTAAATASVNNIISTINKKRAEINENQFAGRDVLLPLSLENTQADNEAEKISGQLSTVFYGPDVRILPSDVDKLYEGSAKQRNLSGLPSATNWKVDPRLIPASYNHLQGNQLIDKLEIINNPAAISASDKETKPVSAVLDYKRDVPQGLKDAIANKLRDPYFLFYYQVNEQKKKDKDLFEPAVTRDLRSEKKIESGWEGIDELSSLENLQKYTKNHSFRDLPKPDRLRFRYLVQLNNTPIAEWECAAVCKGYPTPMVLPPHWDSLLQKAKQVFSGQSKDFSVEEKAPKRVKKEKTTHSDDGAWQSTGPDYEAMYPDIYKEQTYYQNSSFAGVFGEYAKNLAFRELADKREVFFNAVKDGMSSDVSQDKGVSVNSNMLRSDLNTLTLNREVLKNALLLAVPQELLADQDVWKMIQGDFIPTGPEIEQEISYLRTLSMRNEYIPMDEMMVGWQKRTEIAAAKLTELLSKAPQVRSLFIEDSMNQLSGLIRDMEEYQEKHD